MCLAVREIKGKRLPKLRKDKDGHYVGYKVYLRKQDGKLQSELQGRLDTVPEERWIDEKTWRQYETLSNEVWFEQLTGDYYTVGWHIFQRLSDARLWCPKDNYNTKTIRKVRFKEVLERGWQAELPVVVARYVYILPEDKK